jgi:hypothetical protein
MTATAGADDCAPCYLLPLRWETDKPGLAELVSYLRAIASRCEVLVVDGSPDPVFGRHHRALAGFAHHIRPDATLTYRNGKVSGVTTGMHAARADKVIIADDDVRYDSQALTAVLRILDDADVVIPQNYFSPLPWHAAWDSARILINRALSTDYPGTFGVRRGTFLTAGGYDGDVLFENLELMRTLKAAGGRPVSAPHVYIRRLPPDFRHFAGQRVRQAYDSFAQPLRLAAELALLPATVLMAMTRRWVVLGAAACAAVGLAELGRRRYLGVSVFPWPIPLLAPAWLAERSICSWLAVACRLRGGVSYAGQKIVCAASAEDTLCRALALSASSGAETDTPMRAVAERLDRGTAAPA